MLLPLVASMSVVPSDEVAVARPFPALRAEFLNGRTAVLPEAGAGKLSLLLLGFSYDPRWAVEAWAEHFRHEFGSDERVTFFEIPIIGGISKHHDSDRWNKRVQFRDPKAAYLVLLDGKGEVAWRHNGAFDDAAYRELASKMTELLAAMK
jgi:hypothetical protein